MFPSPRRNFHYTILIFTALAFALSGISCQSKSKATATSEAENLSASNGALQASVDSMAAELEAMKLPKDSVLLHFARTYCFGRCPVFKIYVYESGFTTYEGINFVDRMGLYSAHTDKSTIETILKKAKEIDFFDLQDKYDLEGLQDVPSTIISIRNDDITKRVVARYNVPKSLTDFLTFVDETLVENDWSSHPKDPKK